MRALTVFDGGLSPRVRGDPSMSCGDTIILRSIPACAGGPVRYRPREACYRVYPRVCGGTLMRACGDRRDWGLSPRVRGDPPGTASHIPGDGSIPACAGGPSSVASPRRPSSVYPRVCGGTDGVYDTSEDVRGLSPRVRGDRV